jgi:hypothetical protein
MTTKKKAVKRTESSPAIDKAWTRHHKREKVKKLGRGKAPKSRTNKALHKAIFG